VGILNKSQKYLNLAAKASARTRNNGGEWFYADESFGTPTRASRRKIIDNMLIEELNKLKNLDFTNNWLSLT
jgi:hypothetical protein